MFNYKGFATNTFGGLVDKFPDLFTTVKDNLPKSDIKIPYKTYVSLSFFAAMITYVASFSAVIILMQILKPNMLMMMAYVFFIPMISAIVCFFAVNFYPLQKVASRRRNIEASLPFVLTHMGAISESGVPPYVIFKLISQFKEYGEVSTEMRKVVRNIEMFGSDPLTSAKDVAERTPSDSLKQILLGFVTTTESGGNINNFLKSAGQQALFEWRVKRERFMQQLSAYAEFYTGLLIAAPLFIISLFAVMNMIQSNLAGFNILDLMKMCIYLVVPILNSAFLLFLKGVEVEM